MRKVEMEFKYEYKNYRYVKPFTAYLSNSYKLYSYLKSIYMLDTSDDLNDISEKVLNNGVIVENIKIDEYLQQYAFEYNNKIFKFVIVYKTDGSRYALLYDFIEDVKLYSKSKYRNPNTNLFAYSQENTYESFLNYARHNELPANKKTKISFFKDFKSSLFSKDITMYNRDGYFNFLTVENVNNPGEYFYFLIFDGRICITQYTDYRSLGLNDDCL